MSESTKPIIHLGADHGGFELKAALKTWLEQQGYQVIDHGAHQLNPDDDYPEFALAVAQAVSSHSPMTARGILLCRSGGGVTIAANKVKGVRAVSVASTEEAQHAVEHNNAHIISLAADGANQELCKKMVTAFLTSSFAHNERHLRRINQITEYERAHETLSSHSD